MFNSIISIYQRKTIPDEWLNEAYDKKWFKLFLPIACGGLQFSLSEGLEVLYQTAKRHGGFGWVINLGAGAGYFAHCLEEDVSIEIYSNPKAVIAGSGATTGIAIEYKDGFLINGEWKYCTGAAHSSAYTITAILENGDKKSFVLMPEQVTLIDQWNGFGLKPTSSFTVVVNNAWVPNYLKFDIDIKNSFKKYSLHKIPFYTFAKFCMLASLSGIIECYLSYISELGHKIQNRILNELQLIKLSHQKLLEMWQKLSVEFDKNAQQLTNFIFNEEYSNTIYHIYQLASSIYYQGGMIMADESQIVHWAWRDLLMACQHFLLK